MSSSLGWCFFFMMDYFFFFTYLDYKYVFICLHCMFLQTFVVNWYDLIMSCNILYPIFLKYTNYMLLFYFIYNYLFYCLCQLYIFWLSSLARHFINSSSLLYIRVSLLCLNCFISSYMYFGNLSVDKIFIFYNSWQIFSEF